MGKAGRPEGSKKTGMKYLSEEELKLLFREIDKGKDRRDIFLYRLTLFLGLRVGEVVKIKLSDLNLDAHQIFIQALKNGRSRAYDLDEKLWSKLEKYLKARKKFAKKDNPYLFPSTRKKDDSISPQGIKMRFKLYASQAGLNSDFSIHSLRHSIGILQAKNGKSPIEIMGWLRHRNINSTQVYFEQITFEKQDAETAAMMGAYL